MREASGQWEIIGETRFTNTGTEKLMLQSVNLKAFDVSGNKLADRTYDTGKFQDMIVIMLKDPNGYYTQTSASTSELAPELISASVTWRLLPATQQCRRSHG